MTDQIDAVASGLPDGDGVSLSNKTRSARSTPGAQVAHSCPVWFSCEEEDALVLKPAARPERAACATSQARSSQLEARCALASIAVSKAHKLHETHPTTTALKRNTGCSCNSHENCSAARRASAAQQVDCATRTYTYPERIGPTCCSRACASLSLARVARNFGALAYCKQNHEQRERRGVEPVDHGETHRATGFGYLTY